jgi:hypothetical protein
MRRVDVPIIDARSWTKNVVNKTRWGSRWGGRAISLPEKDQNKNGKSQDSEYIRYYKLRVR